MRRQFRVWANRTSVSRRGDSDPFWAKKRAVQSSSPPMVQGCSVRGDGFTSISLLSLAQPLFFVVILQRLDQVPEFPRDDGVEFVEGQIDAVVGDAVLR